MIHKGDVEDWSPPEKNYRIVKDPADDSPVLTFDSYAEAVRHMAEYYAELYMEMDDDGIPTYIVGPIVNGMFAYYPAGNDGEDGTIVSIEPIE